MGLQLLERSEDRVGCLPVIAGRVGFSPSLHSIPIGEADPHHPRVVIAAPGDDEWMLGLQGENVGGELQSNLRRFNPHKITSEEMTIMANATPKPRGLWASGRRSKIIPQKSAIM